MSRSASAAAARHSSAQLALAGGRGLLASTASMSSLMSRGMYFLGYLLNGRPVLPSKRNFSKFPYKIAICQEAHNEEIASVKSPTCTRPSPAGVLQVPSNHLQNGWAPVPSKFTLSVTTEAGLMPYPYSEASFNRIKVDVSGSKYPWSVGQQTTTNSPVSPYLFPEIGVSWC